MANIIHDPLRSAAAPPILFQSRTPHVVEMGFIDFEQEPSHAGSSNSETLTSHPGPQCQTDVRSELPSTSSSVTQASQQNRPSHSSPSSERPAMVTTRETIEKLARKRVADCLAERLPAKKARKRRTCVKCAEPMCPGSQTVKNCKNPCRDCGKRSCRGRNSKKPSTPCHLAWI